MAFCWDVASRTTYIPTVWPVVGGEKGSNQSISCVMEQNPDPNNHGGLFHAIFRSCVHGIVVWPPKKVIQTTGFKGPYFAAAPSKVVPFSNPLKGSIKHRRSWNKTTTNYSFCSLDHWTQEKHKKNLGIFL